MTTTPLTRWKFERVIDGIPCVPTIEAEQARADLEAEVAKLREALQLFNVYVTAMENDDHVAGMLAYGQFEDAARAALECKP